jgi:P2-related tail formation protein
MMGEKRTFSEKVKLNDRVIKEDLSHKAVSGLKAVRKAAIKKANGGGLAFPVVFSSLTEQAYQGGSGLKSLSQLPKHLSLHDTISEVRGGQLYFFWNVAKGVYPEGMTEELFAGYERLLKALAEKPGDWDTMDFNSLIRPKPENYGHSGQAIGKVV